MTRFVILACLLCGLSGTPALAHDVWLTVDKQSDGKFVADVGFGARDERSLADSDKVVVMKAIGPSGVIDLRHPLKPTTRLGQPVIETAPFNLEPGSVLSISYDNGFWVRMPGDRRQTNTTTLLAPMGTEAHWVVKFGKMLFGSGAYSQVLHQRMEVTALRDPFVLKRGDLLPVRVDYEGKPVPGIEVQYDDGVTPISDANAPKVKTDAHGVASIPIDRVGAYLIVVDANEPASDKRFRGYDHVFSSLSFDLTK